MKSEEIVLAVGQMENDFTRTKNILIALVQAERWDEEPNREAWEMAFAAVDRWAAEDGPKARPVTVRCPECGAILPNVANHTAPFEPLEHEPVRIDCGPIHVMHYKTYEAHHGDGETRIEPIGSSESTIPTIGAVLDAKGIGWYEEIPGPCPACSASPEDPPDS